VQATPVNGELMPQISVPEGHGILFRVEDSIAEDRSPRLRNDVAHGFDIAVP
jgi:hypothetical protein